MDRIHRTLDVAAKSVNNLSIDHFRWTLDVAMAIFRVGIDDAERICSEWGKVLC